MRTPHLKRKKKKKKNCVWWCVSVIPAIAESIKKGGSGPGWPGQKARPCLKNNQSRAGGGRTSA
jgi:hypothetical protein